MKTYAVAWVSHNAYTTKFRHGLEILEANSEDEALGICIRSIQKDTKEEQGWSIPKVLIAEVSEKKEEKNA